MIATMTPIVELDWLNQKRGSARSRFEELGFPTVNNEDWRFTDVSPIARTVFAAASSAGRAERFLTAGAGGPLLDASGADYFKAERLPGLPGFSSGLQLVFINGRYAPHLSQLTESDQACAGSLAAWLKNDPDKIQPWLAREGHASAFAALNTAFFSDGAVVYLPKGAQPKEPIRLLFISTPSPEPTAVYPRILIVAESGAGAVVVEEYAGLDGSVCFNNVVAEIELGDNAGLEHYKIQRESPAAFHVASTEVRQGRDSRYVSHSLSWGGSLTRNDVSVLLDAEGAGCSLNGLYMVSGTQLVDNHTKIDHARPHTTSRELYKGVLDGRSRAVFNGTIIVRPNAQKISSVQANRNLLLSEHCRVDTKPEFKIFANDVQCKHGATIGQLSSEAIFYLRSRGIEEQEARRILVYAFMSEMVELIGLRPLRRALRHYV
ncbi:MAG: Fe-S cluster assembly protein SufD [Elusimicrobia bacterium RIFCSPHIGHO2_02_FULL_57_9]|nr:MAG: Fe-S cluster assembly protein SufD [Elusimicrobia bacterium RIFCSPHIGHO2_02_FULL_57_9]